MKESVFLPFIKLNFSNPGTSSNEMLDIAYFSALNILVFV